ncbi:hypothetical protein WDU99_16920 [Microbacterium sp. Mu-80]|uniref:HTH iclR-type domain-containing protein n=1 Tax=Microbacterium bandirmense TaxID=3122050 RepID=A0ABU8LH36_9MICO
MKKNELVWRELIDNAVMHGRRRWHNIEDLAFRAGVAPATASYALRRLIEIGAIQQHHAGFTVVNPEKVLTLSCAARSVMNDARVMVTLPAYGLQNLLATTMDGGLIVGGAAAAVELLGGVNVVSDYSEHLYYLRDEHTADAVDDMLQLSGAKRHTGYGRNRGNVTFLLADPRAARMWQRHSSVAQTYVDLFATPGWQASEFRIALHEKFFSRRDWDQE